MTQITKASKAYWGYSKTQLELWADELTISPAYIEEFLVFKLVSGDTVLAYISLHPGENGRFKLENLFVLPKHIGKGFGKNLLEYAKQQCNALGAKVLWLESDPHATAFYLKQGFVVTGQRESSIPGRFLPVMELPL
ncbi:MAG: GNAT family N-acetyltransferase [Lewinellaceae bacterium]|nr:GNAT family N-acetyltransferase [Lewinellaceae bacterium]MCB9332480.1 GNAT family N-acetyltransferase [Lewinellaceae bacterium]